MSDTRLRLLEREAWRSKSTEAWSRWAEESARVHAPGPQVGPVEWRPVPGPSWAVLWTQVQQACEMARAVSDYAGNAASNVGQGSLLVYSSDTGTWSPASPGDSPIGHAAP